MFKKALTESGRRILKVGCELVTAGVPGWTVTYIEPEVTSLSWSLSSLDTRSIDTYVTYIMEGLDECNSMCCYCIEHENQKNENRENDMII